MIYQVHLFSSICAYDLGVRSRGLVSALYSLLLASSRGPLAVHQVWTDDLDLPSGEICWSTVWNNLDETSKNLDHKLI